MYFLRVMRLWTLRSGLSGSSVSSGLAYCPNPHGFMTVVIPMRSLDSSAAEVWRFRAVRAPQHASAQMLGLLLRGGPPQTMHRRVWVWVIVVFLGRGVVGFYVWIDQLTQPPGCRWNGGGGASSMSGSARAMASASVSGFLPLTQNIRVLMWCFSFVIHRKVTAYVVNGRSGVNAHLCVGVCVIMWSFR